MRATNTIVPCKRDVALRPVSGWRPGPAPSGRARVRCRSAAGDGNEGTIEAGLQKLRALRATLQATRQDVESVRSVHVQDLRADLGRFIEGELQLARALWALPIECLSALGALPFDPLPQAVDSCDEGDAYDSDNGDDNAPPPPSSA